MRTEELLSRFDEWELRTRECRGWPHRVGLEPPFEPLFPELRVRQGIIDDSRSPGIRDRLFGKRLRQLAQMPLREPLAAMPSPDRGNVAELQLLLPEGFTVNGVVAARMLAALRHLEHPLTFELIGTRDFVVSQLCCASSDRLAVLNSLRAFLPELKVRERENLSLRFLASRWRGRWDCTQPGPA